LHPNAQEVQSVWAKTNFTNLNEATAALSKREKCQQYEIGFYNNHTDQYRCVAVPSVLPEIVKWVREKKIDGVVWTELLSNFEEEMKKALEEEMKKVLEEEMKRSLLENKVFGEDDDDEAKPFGERAVKQANELVFSEENALNYVLGLPEVPTEIAREYFFKTPLQIETKVRSLFKIELGWRHMDEYRNGFWLDKNTFINADSVEIKRRVKRLTLGINAHEKSEDAEMLVLTNAVEMTVDSKGKILSVEKKPSFGLWLDAVNQLLGKQALANMNKPKI
jgi:hypothetical protein